MEHHEDGSPNPDGKKLRKKAKQIMLGVMYGMGAKLMSINLGVSMDECKEILNEFAKMFPKIKEFTEYNEQCAKEKGYVEDYLGRRRHLPDAFLTELEIMPKRQVLTDADVIFDMNSSDRCIEIPDEEAWKMWNQKWAEFSQSRRFNAKKEFKETLKSNNVEYQDNGAFISKTMTQCTNARVQGCLSGDTMIDTKEYGIVPIESVVNQRVTVWDGKAWSKSLVLPSGEKQKCIVTFTNGQKIVCSPDHKFGRVPNSKKEIKTLIFTPCSMLVSGHRVRISELSHTDVGNYVSIRHDSVAINANNYYLDMITDSFFRGAFLGRLASDGSISNRDSGGSHLTFIFAEHEKNVLDSFINRLPFKFSLNETLRENRSQKIYTVRIYSKTLVNEILSLDIKHHIDSCIFKDTAMLRGFICGMFDGDGSASCDRVTLKFGTQSDFTVFMRDIQRALLFFGIRSSTHKFSKSHRIDIRKYDVTKFVNRIGFLNESKNCKALGFKCVKDGHIFNDVLIVRDVQFTSESIPMYDVCDTERGYFVADGIVTHNSAASLTKKAMVAIHNDPLMRKYGFRLLIPVHDELLGECKMFYAREAQKRLSELMIQAGLPECSVKMKCDAYCVKHWYADEVSDQIHDTYVQYLSKGMSSEDAISKLCDTYKELQPNSIRKMCNEEFDVLSDLL